MPDKRSILKQGQIDILEVLYKYRFGSRQLVAESLGVKVGSNLYEKLQVLIKHGLVAMRHEKHLKLQGVPAAYYLTPKGLKALQALDGHEYINEAVIKASYRDKVLSQAFINHTLSVFRCTNALKRAYPGTKVYLRRDMSRYSYFPSPLPDAFLSLPMDGSKQPKRFFLDIIAEATPRRALDVRLSNYCEFFEEGGWDVTGSDWPTLVLISEKGNSEKFLQRTARAVLSRNDIEELDMLTSTVQAVSQGEANSKILTHIDEHDELLDLTDREVSNSDSRS